MAGNTGPDTHLLFAHHWVVRYFPPMEKIIFDVACEANASPLVASWNDPRGGGITTQGADLRELQEMIRDAAAGYFFAAGAQLPVRAKLHFPSEPELEFTLA